MIYWNNHHHLLRTLEIPNGWTMWANAHLLFWLSLVFTVGGIGFAFLVPLVSYLFYIAVAIMWVIPDRRIASELNAEHGD